MAKKPSGNIPKMSEKNIEKGAKDPKVAQKEEHVKKEEKQVKASGAEKEAEEPTKDDFEQRITELQDKYLRLSAEFDNYRKRTLREKTELLKSASEDVLIKILPVMDDFERAIGSMEAATDIDAIRAGIYLIYNKFRDFLTQQGVREMDSLNDEFDTDRHEAITKIPVQEEDKKGKVVDVIEKGYMLNEKVVRYAKVIIGE